MMHVVEDPLKSWIPRLFESFTLKDRLRFASAIRFKLEEMNDEAQRPWWNHWLKEYWQNRLDGIPRKLDASEVKAMLEWLPYFYGVFPEAVDCATRMSLCSIEPDTNSARRACNGPLVDVSQCNGQAARLLGWFGIACLGVARG